jgi:uncharacterized protein YndB with AHSA1/START domain
LRNQPARVRRETVLDVRREDVWSALTEVERLADWFAGEVELDLEAGGRGRFRWANGEERRAIVREVVEHERLVLDWADEEGVVSTVELELAEAAEGTRLTVVETATAGVEPAVDWSVAIGLGALARHLDPVLV